MNSKLIAGHVLQGRYRVVRLLGEGGYGAVYLVQDTRLGGKYLALKESFHSFPEAQQQFQLEANLLAGLSHPHLPRVSDYFIEPSGRQYLVMDFIEGQDLAELLVQRRAPLPEGQAVTWMLQVCQAVAHLHSQRPHPIIHRDVKPPNVKITPSGQAVLVDFGIAKVYVPQKGTVRIAKAVSSGFSPPEQYAGSTDARSDVYALGATLYALVTGTVPPDAFDRLVKRTVLVPPTRYNPRLSPAVEQVILQTMELDPRRRFPSAQELWPALQACLSGSPLAPPTPAGAGCPQCHAVNRPGARFCCACGRRLAAPTPPPPSPAFSSSPELNFELGNAYARNDELDLAIQAYRQALAGGLTDPALYHNLGLACIMARRYAEAIAILEQGAGQFADGDIGYQLGRAYALNGQLSDSARVLEQAVRRQPQDAANRVLLGMVLQDQGQHKRAIAVLEQAVRLQKDEAFAHYLLGKSYLFTDQFDRAEKSFAEAVRLQPDDADHHYYLGLARLERKRPDAAVPSFRQALKLEPNHYLAHYFLGQAYLRQDSTQEAARWFERAAALDPADPDPHIGLAVCYALLNRRTDAIAAVRRALVIDPNSQQARDILKKL